MLDAACHMSSAAVKLPSNETIPAAIAVSQSTLCAISDTHSHAAKHEQTPLCGLSIMLQF